MLLGIHLRQEIKNGFRPDFGGLAKISDSTVVFAARLIDLCPHGITFYAWLLSDSSIDVRERGRQIVVSEQSGGPSRQRVCLVRQ